MKKNMHVLIVEDDKEMCKMLSDFLNNNGYKTTYFYTSDQVISEIKSRDFDVIILDLKLPGMNGVELCERITENRTDIPVIVMTAFGSINNAIDAIRAGAFDFLIKPFDLDIFLISVNRAMKHRKLQEKIKTLSQASQQVNIFENFIGNSQTMQTLFQTLSHIINTDITVLISGESGTGKELIAKALHQNSSRKENPFIAINCASLPETLIESELFGYIKGSFTDAKEDKKGLFIQAEGGTLFFDEIGEIPLAFQIKLLRAIEERSIRPLGGQNEIKINVRIISATNINLEDAVKNGSFREDLYYRLNVIQIKVPPLRERDLDILLLTEFFINQFSVQYKKEIKGVSDNASKKLLDYYWPGNVRELRNAIEHAIALTSFEKISVDDLPEKIRAYNSYNIVFHENPTNLMTLEEIEKKYIFHVLKVTNNNQKIASQILGVDRKTLYRKLQKFNSIKS